MKKLTKKCLICDCQIEKKQICCPPLKKSACETCAEKKMNAQKDMKDHKFWKLWPEKDFEKNLERAAATLLEKCKAEHDYLKVWAISYMNNHEIWNDLALAEKRITEMIVSSERQVKLSIDIRSNYYTKKNHKKIINMYWDVRYQKFLIMGIAFYLNIKKKERGI